ncbi:MAG: FHA domain-containing protein [Akkermansiaceae bacterium]
MPRVIISAPDKAPQPYRFPIDSALITIGSAETNDIVIDCGSVSSHHCNIERVQGGYIIRDNNSTNGIKQGDVPLAVADIFDQSDIFIGDIPLLFQLSEEEIENIAAEEFTSHLQYASSKKKGSTGQTLPAVVEDEIDLDPVEEPQPEKAEPQKSRIEPAVIATSSSSGMSTLVLISILGVLLGICMRHYLATGNFFLTELLVKYSN